MRQSKTKGKGNTAYIHEVEENKTQAEHMRAGNTITQVENWTGCRG